MSSPLPQRLPYSAALDGLRALAVVAVLGYHLDIGWMRGGFLGVDLFFVISGFLITRLLLDERRRTGRLSLGAFWMRRFRRLVPPLVIVVGASVAATRLWGVPGQWDTMRGDAIAALGYAANWRFVLNDSSYFDSLVGPSPLRHIWSLAVEEQWYVFWPLVMLALAPFASGSGRSARRVGAILLGAGALSAIWMAVLFDPSDASRVYYGTDTRAQQLLVGAALAWMTVSAPRRFTAGRLGRARFPVTLVMVGFLVAVVTIGDESAWLYRGGLFALSLGAAVLVVAASVPGNGGPLGWLASPFFVGVGRRSYGIYLWHWPVFVFVGAPMGIDLPYLPLVMLKVAITLVINEVMYRWIETPIARGDFKPPRLLVGWTTAGFCAAVASVVLLATDLPDIPDVEVLRPDLEAVAAAAADDEVVPTSTVPPAAAIPRSEVAAREPELAAAPLETETSVIDAPTRVPRLFLAGDSTALVLGAGRPDGLPERWQTTEYAQLGCPITDGGTVDVGDDAPTRTDDMAICEDWESDWSQIAALYRPDVTVVMIGAWEVLDHLVDGLRLSFPSPEWSSHIEDAVRRGVGAATVGGGHAVLLRLPCMEQPAGSLVSTQARNDEGRVAAFNAILEQVASSTPAASTLPLDDLLCPHGDSLDSIDGEAVRSDGVHLTPAGIRLVWEWLDDQLIDFEPTAT